MLESLLSVILVCGLLSFVLVVFSGETLRDYGFGERAFLIFGLALLGGVCGYFSALSRVGVMGNVLPSVLALAGGVSAYLFGIDRSRGVVASVAAIAFSISFAFSAATAAGLRRDAEGYTALVSTCLDLMTDPGIAADDKAFCRTQTTIGPMCLAMLQADFESRFRFPAEQTAEQRRSQLDRQWLALLLDADCPPPMRPLF